MSEGHRSGFKITLDQFNRLESEVLSNPDFAGAALFRARGPGECNWFTFYGSRVNYESAANLLLGWYREEKSTGSVLAHAFGWSALSRSVNEAGKDPDSGWRIYGANKNA
jgi:hypothetical protein